MSKISCYYKDLTFKFKRNQEKLEKQAKDDEYLTKQQTKRENRSQPVIHKDMIKKIAADNVKFKSTMPEKKAMEIVPI